MAAPKRTPTQIIENRAEIARRYLRGETQAAIGRALGMTQQMVSYDLAAIEAAWQKSALYDMDKAKARELARIDHLERTYWEAWEESRQDKEVATQKQVGSGEAQRREATLRKEGQSGNPAFLSGVERCIERRCKLLGLDAPEKSTNVNIDMASLTVDQLERIAAGEDVMKVLASS